MGCGQSNNTSVTRSLEDAHTAMKAAMLIQIWYRRYLARLEAQRRASWMIFQSLEYAGEQEQLRLYNFFNDMMTHIRSDGKDGDTSANVISAISLPIVPSYGTFGAADDDAELMKETDPSDISTSGYKGPQLKFPLTSNQLTSLIEAFKDKKLLHARYVLELLHETRKMLRRQPNICHVTVDATREVTVCGDLHGKLDDLFMILHKNGLPSKVNPYIFNGDFVDRGAYSVEIAVILFVCKLLHPDDVCINRGNHEDHVMNLRYGFIKEIMAKYKQYASKITKLFQDVFSWLSLATIINRKILVCHGGISNTTDLQYLNTINRHEYLSILRPPPKQDGEVNIVAWRQMLDLLWSDPKSGPGCAPNTFRGGGSYFGPDVTKTFMEKNDLQLLIRSHECKPEGYEYDHNKMVLTIFSASNYYEVGSNKGAYIKLSQNLHPRVVQYMVSNKPGRRITIKERVKMNEDSALHSLKLKIYANKSILLDAFKKADVDNTGAIPVSDWSTVMNDVLHVDIPWRSLMRKLAVCRDDDHVQYHTIFEDFMMQNKYNGNSVSNDPAKSEMTETLYRNKAILETIFRAIDKDNSGHISMEEFADSCRLLGQHKHAPIEDQHVREMAHNMDTNKDGYIDFKEFLNAFRIVDHFGKELRGRTGSVDSVSSD